MAFPLNGTWHFTSNPRRGLTAVLTRELRKARDDAPRHALATLPPKCARSFATLAASGQGLSSCAACAHLSPASSSRSSQAQAVSLRTANSKAWFTVSVAFSPQLPERGKKHLLSEIMACSETPSCFCAGFTRSRRLSQRFSNKTSLLSGSEVPLRQVPWFLATLRALRP